MTADDETLPGSGRIVTPAAAEPGSDGEAPQPVGEEPTMPNLPANQKKPDESGS